jgi:hypothetical protein
VDVPGLLCRPLEPERAFSQAEQPRDDHCGCGKAAWWYGKVNGQHLSSMPEQDADAENGIDFSVPANLLNRANAKPRPARFEGPLSVDAAPIAGRVCRVNSPMRAHKPDSPGRCRDAADCGPAAVGSRRKQQGLNFLDFRAKVRNLSPQEGAGS